MRQIVLLAAVMVLVIGCVTSAAPPVAPDRPAAARESSTLDQYHRAAALAAERAGDFERAAAHRRCLTQRSE